MTQTQARVFIALDEWIGILVALRLYGGGLFWPFVVPWAIAVYAISYPLYWRRWGFW